jgi:RecQ family ATP-dependent DNA helicase
MEHNNQRTKRIAAAVQSILGDRKPFPHQTETCDGILSGSDVLLTSPTGSGKSLCYMIPTLVTDKPTLIISPLISLMNDQLEKAKRLGFRARALHSGISPEQQWSAIAKWISGEVQLLFTSPERLSDDRFRRCLRARAPGLIVIDEAHCISTWGHNFRSSYRRIGQLIGEFRDTPTLAMTASANPSVRTDILSTLGLRDPIVVSVPFQFSNLAISGVSVSAFDERIEYLLALLTAGDEPMPMVIFCQTKRQCQLVHARLSQMVPSTVYHSGICHEERSLVERWFQKVTSGVLIATSAYEMGIDKPDIKTVVHFGIPTSLESYVQGIGRAGRNGAPAKSLLFYSEDDLHALTTLLGQAETGTTISERALHDIRCVYQYVLSKLCRMRFLNDYFFSDLTTGAQINCGQCDRCQINIRISGQQTGEAALRSALKCWRKQKAKDLKKLAFEILTDREINRINMLKPQNESELSQIAGIRRSSSIRFGAEIVAVVQALVSERKSCCSPHSQAHCSDL